MVFSNNNGDHMPEEVGNIGRGQTIVFVIELCVSSSEYSSWKQRDVLIKCLGKAAVQQSAGGN